MEDDKQSWRLWVDWEKYVISFHREDGFSEVRFPTREEMISFAVEKSKSGFGIQ